MIGKQNVPLGGGVNLHADPTVIPDGQWQRLRNLAPRKPGILGQRPSMSFVREVTPHWKWWDARTFSGMAGVSAVEDYWNWAIYLRPVRFIFDPNWGEITMVAITTGAMYVYDQTALDTQELRQVPAGTMLLITLPGFIVGAGAGSIPYLRCAVLGTATTYPSLFVFNGVTYAFAGQSNGRQVAAGVDSTVPVAFCYKLNNFGDANEDFHPEGACVVRDRVLYYKGPNVYFSDRNEPLTVGYTGTLDTDGNIVPSTANPAAGTNFSAIATRGIYLGGEELENITAVAEVNTSADGSPVQSVAMVFTTTHAYMLLGEPLETTEGGDILGSLQINRLNVQAGCVSQGTITRTPYGTIWCGRDDVWFMPFGSLPVRVGTNIRALLEQQPAGLLWKLHAEYADGFYRLSMFKPGQGPNVYDPCGMQMWLDMRSGGPKSAADAQWFGPQEFNQTDGPTTGGGFGTGDTGTRGVWAMARDTRATGDGRLYALQSYIMWGDEESYIRGLSLCSFDSFDGKDTCAPQASVTKWNAATIYYEGDIMVPTPASTTTNHNAPIWVCTTSGTSHASTEPSWNADTASGQLTDGTVVWTLRYWIGTYASSGYAPPMMQGNNEVELSMLSKEFMLGDPMREKLLDGAELGYFATNRTQVTYNSHAKQDSRSRILGLSAEQTADNVANQTTGDRVWQRKLLTPDPTKRFHGLSATWELQQDAGIVITAGVNDTITVDISGITATLTLTPGYYADLTTLNVELMQQLTTAIPQASTTIADDGGVLRNLFGFRSTAGTGANVYTDSRLAQLLGYSPQQGEYAEGAGSLYAFGYESPRDKHVPDIQFSGLNLRFKTFGRGPT